MAAKKSARKTVSLGDLVALAFDVAAGYSDDQKEVSRIAARALSSVLATRRSAHPAQKATAVFNGAAVEVGDVETQRAPLAAQAA